MSNSERERFGIIRRKRQQVIGAIPSLEIPPPALALVLAYIAGGTIMNILRHELPDTERDGDVGAFVIASVVYGTFTILLEPAAL